MDLVNFNKQDKRRQLLQLEYIETGDKSLLKQIEAINSWQLGLMVPKSMLPKDPHNEVKRIDDNFESACIYLESKGFHNPKNMTVYEFEKRIKMFEPKSVK